jgi:hypothetical protein
MNPHERQIIDDLFDKLREVEQQSDPREPIAEAHIRSRVQQQPGVPYYMAQTILMQEQALQTAQARITELEDEVARRPAGGGFLSGLFGGEASCRLARPSASRTTCRAWRPRAQGSDQAFLRRAWPLSPDAAASWPARPRPRWVSRAA